jgi:hypothetical protein
MSTFFLIDVFVFLILGGYMSEELFIRAGHLLPLLAAPHSRVYMVKLRHSSEHSKEWSAEARSLAQQARVLSGNKLEQLVVRLQRNTGKTREACWRFIIQYGLKGQVEHRRWTEPEIEFVREELVKDSVEKVARKLKRSPKALRSMLKRHRLSLRDIRCDRFSLESLATALHVNKSEIHFWIKQGWLQAVVETNGKKQSYTITPEALTLLYKRHLPDVLKRGTPNRSLFEAYLQYCYSPKHTVGEHLLDVRRDKKERAAYAELHESDELDEEEDTDDDGGYSLSTEAGNELEEA